ncbi:hypothetical protein [Elizabethkingia bruuniana]|uniref:Bacteriocin n=1 Tax=Elizabethkingia bruuniana TaxID=1756149 RepID=A0A7T7ZWH6_9FLAO|nr:hypothetical protein [Elizabethkingia bruuniana]QQN57207.1 hypothetical protein I6H88_12140 [Elizabethkingia bruuniana]
MKKLERSSLKALKGGNPRPSPDGNCSPGWGYCSDGMCYRDIHYWMCKDN